MVYTQNGTGVLKGLLEFGEKSKFCDAPSWASGLWWLVQNQHQRQLPYRRRSCVSVMFGFTFLKRNISSAAPAAPAAPTRRCGGDRNNNSGCSSTWSRRGPGQRRFTLCLSSSDPRILCSRSGVLDFVVCFLALLLLIETLSITLEAEIVDRTRVLERR